MTAPNLRNPTTMTGKTARQNIGVASTVGILTNATSSGKVLKINSIFAANVDGANAVDVSISVYDGSSDVYVAKAINVPPKATQVISQKDTYFYLEEGDQLRVEASAANDVNIVVGYEDIS